MPTADQPNRLATARARELAATTAFADADKALAQEHAVQNQLRATPNPTAASGPTWTIALAELQRQREACEARLVQLRAAHAEARARLDAASAATRAVMGEP